MQVTINCVHCGKEFTFDTDKTERNQTLMEGDGAKESINYYKPTCPQCGQINKVQPKKKT